MGSDRRMCETQLWLLAFLAFSFQCSLANPLKIMSAPNVLRVGTAENVFVECQGCTNENLLVHISVLSHPTRGNTLARVSVILNKEKDFQDFGQITIPTDSFSKDPDRKQYVYLQAQFPGELLEKVVLVSFQSGYIFIQTDKTLYTPNSKVFYRIFAVTPRMKPVDRHDTTQADASITIEIVTPEGITLSPSNPVSLESGIYAGEYQLSDLVSLGVWKVVAKFPSSPQYSYSAEFEVKEYVLPSFEVKLTSSKSFFHVDSKQLTISIEAKYLFGEEVEGTAYAVFGVVQGGQKKSFPSSLQRVSVESGEAEVTLMKEHITQHFDINNLVKSSIFVAVSVLTESGGEMVEAELRNIQIVTSPYTIQFTRTSKYFKPGMDFDVVVEVLNPDGSPAIRVPVVANPGQVVGSTGENGMARLSINTHPELPQLEISARTNAPDVTQASAEMTALPYTTKSKSYIHVGIGKAETKLGDNLKVNFNYNKQQSVQNDITYLILSRGQLVKYGRYRKTGELVISKTVEVTKDMMPSFRIIAYYHTDDNEVVSDSIWVDVEDSCMGSLTLEPKDSTRLSFDPAANFQLKITGDPEATVALVAVDKGVFVLNNKYRLTQKKVWSIVEKHDTGCTPGGGKDSMGVFYDAGLVFMTNMEFGTAYRQELKCTAPTRRKRATTSLDSQTSLLSQFADKKQRNCCLDGMRETPVSYTCERRSEYIMDGAACVAAFLQCCKEIEKQQAEAKEDSLILARSEEDDSTDFNINEVVSRSKFPESWHWTSIKLPACPEPNCATTSFTTKEFPLKDTITTWQFIGIGLSRDYSICVANPLSVIARKDFFIKLHLPYSVVRGEQVEIKAIIHNYRSVTSVVRVDLIENVHICSGASGHGRYRQVIRIRARSTQSVPFVLIPMKTGLLDIEVKAAVQGRDIGDGVLKKLQVVPEGILTKSVMSVTFDPARRGGRHEEIMNSRIPMRDLVPGMLPSTQISVSGREQLGELVENAIGGTSMGSLIYQPSGCGEQNMMHMTLPVIATTYLDKTNQWETVGFQKRDEALKHIRTGYNNELFYRKDDGSFCVFESYPSSTWLTAYVAKVFSMAHDLVRIDRKIICEAVQFVINTQRDDGMFRDIGQIIMSQMIGDVRGKDTDVSMTAFCLITLQESRRLCESTIPGLQGRITKAVTYLEGRLQSITNSYAAAMASYALANENRLNRQILSKFISPDLNHWPVHDSHLFTLEATAYALLALVKVKALDEARPVVRWFNQQQKSGGGYGSTQATIMVYQAIAEYWTKANEQDYNVDVNLKLPIRSKPILISFSKANHYATKRTEMRSINEDVKVVATGTGEITVKMVSLYYVLPQKRESDCQRFNLSVKFNRETDEKTYRLKIEVKYLNTEHDATMAILDVGLLSGFSANTRDLDLLSKGASRIIARYDINSPVSHTGSVIIYLDKISHKRQEEISFRVHQDLEGGNLQPAAVSVYEYYDHQNKNETHCVKFYHPNREEGELLRLCSNPDTCTCAEEECTMQRREKVDNADRLIKSCESTEDGKTDYVYKVSVEEFTHKWATDIYKMKVVKVIKEGADVGAEDHLREYLSHKRCRKALNLEVGKTYLIMGVDRDVRIDKDTLSYQYVLGERTWIEYWPLPAECQTAEHTDTCKGIEELEHKYRNFGCNQK
ncbi:complement C3-like [Trachinotus anak]|uniref:complement C3-like n=1 Tax=Trachinotus anak TaxID=443729 RepID=UPI0039F1D71B